jgi:hypothetical protein
LGWRADFFPHLLIVFIRIGRIEGWRSMALGFEGFGTLLAKILLKYDGVTCVSPEKRNIQGK